MLLLINGHISRILMFSCRLSQIILSRMITLAVTIESIKCNRLTMSMIFAPNPLKIKCFNLSSAIRKKDPLLKSKELKQIVQRLQTWVAT